MPCTYLPKSITYLLEGIDLVDHRPDGAALEQVPERVHVGAIEARDEEHGLPAAADRSELHSADVAEGPEERRAHGPADDHEASVRLQDALARPERLAARDVEQNVVLLPVPREVVLRVVDHAVGAESARLLDIPCAADRGHLGAERLCDLDREGADPAGRA